MLSSRQFKSACFFLEYGKASFCSVTIFPFTRHPRLPQAYLLLMQGSKGNKN